MDVQPPTILIKITSIRFHAPLSVRPVSWSSDRVSRMAGVSSDSAKMGELLHGKGGAVLAALDAVAAETGATPAQVALHTFRN
jgi:hypothetical protein